jgi:phosphoribosyl 1,2-cyclic phosphodiesterase
VIEGSKTVVGCSNAVFGDNASVSGSYVPAVQRLTARVPNAATLRRSILSHHTSVEDVGQVAEAPGVKTLVLSHLVPPDDPTITDQMWIDGARSTYRGQIIVGRDLLEI